MSQVTRIKTKMPSPYELTAVHQDTHDTKTFCFALPEDATLDMLPGDHLYVHATINDKAVKRPYTPSSVPGTTGYFDLTVKRYELGLVSKYLHDRNLGDTVLMSGPNAGGHWVDGMANQVGFVAGGTVSDGSCCAGATAVARSFTTAGFFSSCAGGTERLAGRSLAAGAVTGVVSCRVAAGAATGSGEGAACGC